MVEPRARFGFIAPATCETTLVELYRLLPAGVSVVTSTLLVNRISSDELGAESRGMDRAARELAAFGAEVIGISGAPIAYLSGPGSDHEMAARVSELSGRPAFYDITAVHDALRSFGARRVAIASPFTDEINEPMRRFFSAAGFDVATLVGGTYRTNAELRRVAPYVPYRFGRQALLEATDAEALFINCAGWATLPSIPALERDFGVPVVTQMQALAWRARQLLGISGASAGLGRLMGEPGVAQSDARRAPVPA